MTKGKKTVDKVKPLDEPYNTSPGFEKHGSPSKRQMLKLMKFLQKIKTGKEFRNGGQVDISNYKGQF